MVGVWVMCLWEQMGQPQRVNLIELGPGRGTLIADLLRVYIIVTFSFMILQFLAKVFVIDDLFTLLIKFSLSNFNILLTSEEIVTSHRVLPNSRSSLSHCTYTWWSVVQHCRSFSTKT